MATLSSEPIRQSQVRSQSYSGTDSSSINALDPGAQIEMSAAVSGVVPDDSFTVDHAIKLSLITGLCWMADSMEMMILAIIGPALHCAWHLSEWKQAFLTTSVFLGMMLSSAFWGNLSDKYGRRRSLRLAAVVLSYWGILSAFAPTYVWIVFLRALVGFGIGCVPQSVIFMLNFAAEHRGKCVVLLDCFWAVGACIEVMLALLVMPTLGWRGLLILSALPLALFVIVCQWLPESARYDAASGNSERALSTLRKIASENGKHMLLGRLIVDDVAQVSRGRIQDLLVDELRWTTLLSSCSFCYYGVVLMTTELFDTTGDLCSISEKGVSSTCTADCRPLTSSDYLDILWTTFAEFPGIFFTIFVIEKLGRKKTIALEFIIFAVSIVFLFICTSSRFGLLSSYLLQEE
ncbi:Synaptic vesicle 2-related protein [Armadillidium vulgare]|nr:Synaptic vesicle 2-related protein [Armadillidium vulgare]